MALIYNHDAVIAEWVLARIPHAAEGGFGKCKAIGVINEGGALIAGVVYHDWAPKFRTMAASIAASTPRFATPETIRAFLRYPFVGSDVFKLWMFTPLDSARTLRFVKGLGFKQEAVLRHHVGENRHAVVCSMTVREWERSRWATRDEQGISARAA